jgi:DNA-binding transcriptional ArsR family regulator
VIAVSVFELQAEVFKTLANAQRLRIIDILNKGETGYGDLVVRMGISQSALSQHLARLRAVDAVSTRRNSTMIFYSLTPLVTKTVSGYLATLLAGPDRDPATEV